MTEHKRQNTEHRAQSTEHRIQSTEHRIQSTEHRIQSTKDRIQSTEHRIQSTEHRIQSTKDRIQSTDKKSLGSGFCVLRSEKGIALVMVLVLAFISLSIVSALLFITTQGTRLSGEHRFFRTAEDASYGGAEIFTEYVGNRGTLVLLPSLPLDIPSLPAEDGFTNGCDCGDPIINTDNIDLMTGAVSCRCDKLCNATADYDASCDEYGAGFVSLDPTALMSDGTTLSADMTFELGRFTIFTKIADTVHGTTDVGGIVTGGTLYGGSVTTSSASLINPPLVPYLYRLEVQAQDTNNPRERSRLSVLYAY